MWKASMLTRQRFADGKVWMLFLPFHLGSHCEGSAHVAVIFLTLQSAERKHRVPLLLPEIPRCPAGLHQRACPEQSLQVCVAATNCHLVTLTIMTTSPMTSHLPENSPVVLFLSLWCSQWGFRITGSWEVGPVQPLTHQPGDSTQPQGSYMKALIGCVTSHDWNTSAWTLSLLVSFLTNCLIL